MIRFSIITVTFNSEKTLQNCLNSVRNLNVSSEVDYEHLIIDGGSTDDTLRIIKDYSSNSSKSHYLSENDNGIYDALNKGIKLSTGEYILLLHSDDRFANNDVLLVYHQVLKSENFNLDMIYSDLILVEKSGKVVRRWRPGKFQKFKLFYGWMPPHPTILADRKLYDTFGQFDISFRISADYEFVLRLLKMNNLRSYYLPKVTYIMGTDGVSNNNFFLKIKEDFRALRKHFNFFYCILVTLLKRVHKINQVSILTRKKSNY